MKACNAENKRKISDQLQQIIRESQSQLGFREIIQKLKSERKSIANIVFISPLLSPIFFSCPTFSTSFLCTIILGSEDLERRRRKRLRGESEKGPDKGS